MATLHRDHLCDDEEQDRIESINGDDDEERKRKKERKKELFLETCAVNNYERLEI